MESCAVMCQAVDLALRCNPQQFLSVVGDALTATEGQHVLDGKRRRRANKCTTGGSGSSSLCVRVISLACEDYLFCMLHSSCVIVVV